MFTSTNDFEFVDPAKLLGHGQFSKVRRVRHKQSGCLFALKEVSKQSLSFEDKENIDEEIEILSCLDHPNIVRLAGHFETKEAMFIFLELLDNGCLFYYVDYRLGLPERLAVRFFYQTVLAVSYIHSLEVVHRDIKPENLLLDDNYDIKLCDFGWACLLGPGRQRRSLAGTFEYMSPEVAERRGHDKRTDVWSLGVLLFELVHGGLIRLRALSNREPWGDHRQDPQGQLQVPQGRQP